MKKIAWPWVGTTEHEMGSMAPKGKIIDREEESHDRLDALIPEKSLVDGQEIITYDNAIISPVEDVSYVKDKNTKNNKASVEIKDEEGLITNFSCNVAKTIQEKVSGLQAYDHLKDSAGLIFEYKKPEDVVYHMGTVKFPIDIIFADSDDKIKKIYKNIQPGTLGTFGCAGVKKVLEICGGLSDRLGIKIGNKLCVSKNKDSELLSISKLNQAAEKFGIRKNIIIKYSGIEKNGFSKWNDFPILSINDSFNKTASKINLFSDLSSKFIPKNKKEVYAFNLDNLIEKSPFITIYKTKEFNSDDIPHISLNGKTATIQENSNKKIHFKNFKISDLDENETIISSLNRSFKDFLSENSITEEKNKLFAQIKQALHDDSKRIIILTAYSNLDDFKQILDNRIGIEFGETLDLECLNIPKNADAFNIINFLKNKLGNKDIKLFVDENFLKKAGSPVPDEVKEKAKKAYKLFHSASEIVGQSLENMTKNLNEYNKIKENSEAILNSKGQYNQSIKRNTIIVRNYLIRIRDGIKILNTIKDISTTSEIIDSLASSAKIASDSIENIFELIEQLDNPDFVLLLSEKVGNYEKVIEDLKSSLQRAMDYINSNILGLIILSS